ncbi:MAG: chorismate synthase [Pseudonocardiales bacterium]|nr:chorismate synthase [Pseudonocardiales bacterium]
MATDGREQRRHGSGDPGEVGGQDDDRVIDGKRKAGGDRRYRAAAGRLLATPHDAIDAIHAIDAVHAVDVVAARADDDDDGCACHRSDGPLQQAQGTYALRRLVRPVQTPRRTSGEHDRVHTPTVARRTAAIRWAGSERLGHVLRWITAGESHGPALVAVLDGLPSGIEVTTHDLGRDLARRRLGYGRGARMKFEQDEVELTGGVRHGVTMGGPVAVRVGNSEWPKWQTVMAADPVDADELADQARNEPLTRPRPGHADLAGMQKYDLDDARPVLERASARETAARVALGTVAKAFLRQALGVQVVSHVVSIGSVSAPAGVVPGPDDEDAVDTSEVRCVDPDASAAMIAEIDATKKAGDTLGGVVEVLAYGLPPGLGSHVQGDRRLDARLAAALMGIQAIKGVEVGDGFELARIRGSQAQDEIVRDGSGAVRRVSGRSGGTEGGMTTGEVLRVRAAMKPISTIPRALQTVDVATGDAAVAINQRSDVCAVPAAGVVAEAVVALVLADAVLEKFGGDSVAETRRNAQAYRRRLGERGLTPAPER